VKEFWGVHTLKARGYCPAVVAVMLPIINNAVYREQIDKKVQSQVNGLQHRLTGMARQMRRCLSSLCGTTDAKADAILQHMRTLRQRMFATRRQITNLKYQNGARN
jgi:hypothetical protein